MLLLAKSRNPPLTLGSYYTIHIDTHVCVYIYIYIYIHIHYVYVYVYVVYVYPSNSSRPFPRSGVNAPPRHSPNLRGFLAFGNRLLAFGLFGRWHSPNLRGGGRVLLTEIMLPRIARQGTLSNFNRRTSSKSSNREI